MKRKLIFGIIFLCVLFSIGSLFLHIRNIHFQQKYSLSKSLTFWNKTDEIKSIDMQTGRVQITSPSDYSLSAETDLLLAVNGAEQADVFLYSGGISQHLFSTAQYTRGQPVMFNSYIYFIAAETNEEYNSLTVADAYLWSYENGVIQKQSDVPVDRFCNILKAEDYLIFVEGSGFSDDAYQIVSYDPIHGEKSSLCAGRYPCWKDVGSSFFFGMPEGGLAVYDLTTNSITVLEETLELRRTPVYNAEDGVLFLTYPDPYNQKAIDLETSGLYYLEYKKLVSYRDYFKRMSWGWHEEYYDRGTALFWK